MNVINLSKGCYGESIFVDDVDVTYQSDAYNPNLLKAKAADEAREKILKALSEKASQLSPADWHTIVDIIVNSEYEYELVEDKDLGSCDTCGDWSWSRTYKKVENGNID